MLGLAFFKSLVKQHGQKYFEPIGKALQQAQIRNFKPYNPRHLWLLRHELGAYTRWSMGQSFTRRDRQTVESMDPGLAEHLAFALDLFQQHPRALSAAMRKHQLKLADRQCRMAELSQRVQETVILVVTALWGHRQHDEAAVAAADMLCQDLHRKLTGGRPTDRYFRDTGKLADIIIGGGFDALAGVPRAEILMKYENVRK
jgi:hypothetical protein